MLPASPVPLINIGGCEFDNLGYDGPSYLNDWPAGAADTPIPTLISSPLTRSSYNVNYSQVAFNTDLPAIEGDLGTCNINTGKGCTLIPPTDDNGAPAAFYPYYTMGIVSGACYWSPGRDVLGFTTNDFGKNAQYGNLLKVTYAGLHGTTTSVYQDFNGPLANNPCTA